VAAVVLLRPGDKMEGGLEGEGHGGLNHGRVLFSPSFQKLKLTSFYDITGLIAEANKQQKGNRDWNEEFQKLLERPSNTPEEVSERTNAIKNLSDEFVAAAIPVVKTIVFELALAPEKKTVSPLFVEGSRFLLLCKIHPPFFQESPLVISTLHAACTSKLQTSPMGL